jgi:fibronectin type 3 domain-containing protein
MKKFFLLLAALVLLASCKQPTDDDANKITFTIKNESSYDLAAVKWVGVSFGDDSNLLKSVSSTKEVGQDDIGYINFTRKDIGIALRTNDTYQSNSSATITDNTIVLEVGNDSNKGTLKEIGLQPKLTVERNALLVAPNDEVTSGESITNQEQQIVFSIKNTGKGTLTFTGNSPVKSSDPAFVVIQPSGSTIAPDAFLGFTLKFTPTQEKTYITTVTIASNDKAGEFSFTVSGTGVVPKPIFKIFYGENEISQIGTVSMGEVIVTQSIQRDIILKNTGTEVLTIDTANITITGADEAVFTKLGNPSPNISPGSDSRFTIQCTPTHEGENNATLIIPNNDGSRNPAMIYLKTTGLPGGAILELRQGETFISNNDINPVDFGQVDVGTNKSLTFTIKNTGNIPLQLNGTPKVGSTNTAFTVLTQPAVSSIAPDELTSFIIQYAPSAEGNETAEITISNNSVNSPFVFKVSGITPKPIINIFYNNAEIPQNGTIDGDETVTGVSIAREITIKNTGAALLTLGTITITGADAAAFSLATSPSPNISAGTDSKLSIQCTPTKLGESSATITIPANDPARNPVVFHIKVTGTLVNPPTGLSVSSVTSDSITLSWNAVTGATGYFVYRATSSDSTYTKITTSAVTEFSYTDTGRTASKTYYYKVSSNSGAGEGAQSAYISTTTVPPEPTVTAGDAQLMVSWTAVDGAIAYEVWTGTVNNSAAATKYGADISGLSATISGLNNGTTYYVWIKVRSSEGTGGFSAGGSGTPLAPSGNLQATTQSVDSIRISWDASIDGVSYQVYRSDTSGGEYAPIGTSSTTFYTNTGLSEGTTYYYKVSTVKGNSESALSSPAVSATTQIGTSSTITLAIQNDVAISTQSVSIPRGQSRIFQVTGNYTSYQWYLNGSAISGAVAASYTLNTASMKMGVYELTVIVRTDTGAKLSGSCRVSVE